MKSILIVVFLFIQTNTNSQSYEFVNDCLAVFIKLDSATKEFESTVKTEKNKQILQQAVKNYTNQIVLYSMNRMAKYTKSEDKLMRQVSNNLTNTLTSLVHINYKYLDFITNEDYSSKELKREGLQTLSKINLESRKFIDVSTGICMVTIDKKKKTENQKQNLLLTLEQRNELNKKMENHFGELTSQSKTESTHFEKSTAIIHHFINLKSEFSTN